MLEDAILTKLKMTRAKTPNILSPNSPGFDDGKKKLLIAPAALRSIAQNIIDETPEHRHLKKAKILLLLKYADGDAKKVANAERLTIGTAARASGKDKVLGAIGSSEKMAPDFIVTLSGDWLMGKGIIPEDDSVAVNKELNEEQTTSVLGLIDHELSHCGAETEGEYVADGNMKIFIEQREDLYIETCENTVDDDGKILIRYYRVDKACKYIFKVRVHDIQEFNGTVARYGKYSTASARFVDVIKKSEKTLFSKAS